MKLIIKFPDNDYYNTFYGVLSTLKCASKWNEKYPKDKEALCIVINSIIYGCYLLFQKSDYEHLSTKEYLKISINDILIDDEVEQFLSSKESENITYYSLIHEQINCNL